jgi:hypothetical protein
MAPKGSPSGAPALRVIILSLYHPFPFGAAASRAKAHPKVGLGSYTFGRFVASAREADRDWHSVVLLFYLGLVLGACVVDLPPVIVPLPKLEVLALGPAGQTQERFFREN